MLGIGLSKLVIWLIDFVSLRTPHKVAQELKRYVQISLTKGKT